MMSLPGKITGAWLDGFINRGGNIFVYKGRQYSARDLRGSRKPKRVQAQSAQGKRLDGSGNNPGAGNGSQRGRKSREGGASEAGE